MSLRLTWGALVAMSLLTAALVAAGPSRPWLVAGVLLLAGLKSRLILRSYLELRQSPSWARGFDLVLALLLLAFAALALAG